jgi:hypothetical protein
VDGADWVDGATVVVDGARGVVGVCAPTGAAIARTAAKAVPVKRWFIGFDLPMGATRAKDREVLIPPKTVEPRFRSSPLRTQQPLMAMHERQSLGDP